jgi:hypothetical protein
MHEIGARTVGPTNMLARCAWCHFSNSISQGRGSSRWITCSSSTCGVVNMVTPAYYNANISCQFSDAPSCAGNSYQIWLMIGQLFQAQHMNDHQPEHSEPTVPKGTHRHCLDEKIWSGHLGKMCFKLSFQANCLYPILPSGSMALYAHALLNPPLSAMYSLEGLLTDRPSRSRVKHIN